jgi:hypothetical protein
MVVPNATPNFLPYRAVEFQQLIPVALSSFAYSEAYVHATVGTAFQR